LRKKELHDVRHFEWMPIPRLEQMRDRSQIDEWETEAKTEMEAGDPTLWHEDIPMR
jgi:hypothetical protein